jgi:DNA-binding MarR family transcriptional regulator
MEVASSKKSRSAEPSVGVLLKRAEQAMVKAKNAVLKPVGLTLAQYVALLELERQPGITAATLARASFVSPQAIMILLKSMEQQGLITRLAHPRHANVLELHMTDVGREALHTARVQIDPVERRVANAFSTKEMASLRALLSRFVEAIDPE